MKYTLSDTYEITKFQKQLIDKQYIIDFSEYLSRKLGIQFSTISIRYNKTDLKAFYNSLEEFKNQCLFSPKYQDLAVIASSDNISITFSYDIFLNEIFLFVEGQDITETQIYDIFKKVESHIRRSILEKVQETNDDSQKIRNTTDKQAHNNRNTKSVVWYKNAVFWTALGAIGTFIGIFVTFILSKIK